MQIPAEALDLIKSFEGYIRRLADDRAAPYICPAGVPTIGYGSIYHFPSRRRVTMADAPITRQTATEYLNAEIEWKARAVDAMTTVRMHPLMRGAIVSFAFNCGEGAYRASSLRAAINRREWDRVPAELAKWRRGGGRVLAGLVRRRNAEAALFMRGVRLLDVEPANTKPPAVPAPKPSRPASPSAWRRVIDWIWS